MDRTQPGRDRGHGGRGGKACRRSREPHLISPDISVQSSAISDFERKTVLPTLRTRCACVLVLMALATGVVAVDKPDRHVTTCDSRELFVRSAFAHGYMHGYEEGFHAGDSDLQIGRGARDPQALAGFRTAKAKYRVQFGDRGQFEEGYREGFRAGYSDSVQGVPFRAEAQSRIAARELAPASQPVQSFDEGFREGYFGGRSQGVDDGRRQARYLANLDFLTDYCRARYPGHHPADVANFCQGFKCGYALGYSDGYVNQNPDSESQVQVAERK